MEEKKKGIVKWFNERKGYGFITLADGSGDVFVHYSALEGSGFRTLNQGEEVELEVITSKKGPKAAKVWRSGQPTAS